MRGVWKLPAIAMLVIASGQPAANGQYPHRPVFLTAAPVETSPASSTTPAPARVGTGDATGSPPAAAQPAGDGAARRSERLALIKRRGTLLAGIKTDYPPFGTVNENGVPIGFEHDLAEDIARRIGVTLTKVTVSSANRLQKLEEGAVDMVIATQGDTADRRKIATQIEPNYYSSGVTLFVPPDSQLRDWSDVRGQKVCATQGAYFNREMARRYLLDLQMFGNARDAKLAVRDKRCVGYMFDNTALAADVLRPEWAGYKMPLAVSLVTPWSIAIGRGEDKTDFEALVSDAVADWHRTGFLIEREKAWGLQPSKFLQDMRVRWTQKGPDGQFICRRFADGSITPECRNQIFLSAADASGLRRFGLQFKDLTGIDLTILYDTYDRSAYFSGLLVTLLLTVLCIGGSLAVGILGALAAERKAALLRRATLLVSVCGRMTPPLLQIYLVLVGVGSLLTGLGITLNPLVVVVACLSYYTGSSVMVAMLEAAGVRRRTVPDYRITLRTLREIVPNSSGPVVAALVNVSKATMMGSAVAVPELLSAATSIVAEHGNVGVVMNALLLTFLALIFVVVRVLGKLERKLAQEVAQ